MSNQTEHLTIIYALCMYIEYVLVSCGFSATLTLQGPSCVSMRSGLRRAGCCITTAVAASSSMRASLAAPSTCKSGERVGDMRLPRGLKGANGSILQNLFVQSPTHCNCGLLWCYLRHYFSNCGDATRDAFSTRQSHTIFYGKAATA